MKKKFLIFLGLLALSLTISLNLQAAATGATLDGYIDVTPFGAVNLVVRFFTPNTQTEILKVATSTDSYGNFTVKDIPAGTYDVGIKADNSLSELEEDKVFVAGQTTSIDFGNLRRADVTGDDLCNAQDISILGKNYMKYGDCYEYSGNWTMPYTPLPPPSMINAIWFEHDRIDWLLDNATEVLDYLAYGKISLIFLFTGYWTTDNEIDYDDWATDSNIEDITDAIHSYSGYDFKVFAWIASGKWNGPPPGLPNINVSTPEKRQQLVNESVACVNKGFDGFDCDDEGFDGTWDEYIIYIDLLTSELHNNGKLSANSQMALDDENTDYEEVYGGLNVDYVKPMLYTSDEGDFKERMRWALGNSTSPILLGIPAYDGVAFNTPMTEYFSWIDEVLAGGSYPMLEGIAIYDGWNDGMWYNDNWDDWNSWTTKD